MPAGALVGDEVEAETALLRADGTVQLPASSAVFGAGSGQALSVWPLAGSSADLRQGGKVAALLHMRLSEQRSLCCMQMPKAARLMGLSSGRRDSACSSTAYLQISQLCLLYEEPCSALVWHGALLWHGTPRPFPCYGLLC